MGRCISYASCVKLQNAVVGLGSGGCSSAAVREIAEGCCGPRFWGFQQCSSPVQLALLATFSGHLEISGPLPLLMLSAFSASPVVLITKCCTQLVYPLQPS